MEILPVIELESQIEEQKIEQKIESEEENEDPYEEDIVPEVVEKKTIPEEDIFVDKKKPPPSAVRQKKPVKLKKNGEPRKEATPEQLARLKAIREKALAVRRAKAQEKKELKELQDKKKKKDIQKLREEVEEKSEPSTPQKVQPSLLQSLDPETIRKLQLEAIEGYDKLRKERKAQKKKAEAQMSRDTRNMNVINNALNPPQPAKYGDPNFFSHLF
jgi:hypothetical protein